MIKRFAALLVVIILPLFSGCSQLDYWPEPVYVDDYRLPDGRSLDQAVFGKIIADNATGYDMTLALADTWYKFDGEDTTHTTGVGGVTYSNADHSLIIETDGYYHIIAAMTYSIDSASSVVWLGLQKNGVTGSRGKMAAESKFANIYTFVVTQNTPYLVAGDKISVAIMSDSIGDTVSVYYLNLQMDYIGK